MKKWTPLREKFTKKNEYGNLRNLRMSSLMVQIAAVVQAAVESAHASLDLKKDNTRNGASLKTTSAAGAGAGAGAGTGTFTTTSLHLTTSSGTNGTVSINIPSNNGESFLFKFFSKYS